MRAPIYLDNHATTPVDPRVLEAMLPFFGAAFGNAASRSHRFGWEAEQAVELARRRIAALAGAAPREIVFTSGATESDNLALKGAWEAYRSRGVHIVSVATEHKAVLDPACRLQSLGAELTVLPCRGDGLIDLDVLRDAIRPQTVLVSVMYANNEIGVLQPVREIGEICHKKGALFHCDAAQAFGKVPIDVNRDRIDLMSLSAHKMCGPKGIGALYVRRRDPRVSLQAQMDGGGHEFGMRSGTLNVPGIVGFGASCEICAAEMETESARVLGLRERLRKALESLGGRVNGSLDRRLSGNLNMRFQGIDAEALLMSMPDIAASTGSACSSATVEPSHVLRALGIGEDAARSSIRFGLGRFNTEEEIDYAAGRVREAVARLRGL